MGNLNGNKIQNPLESIHNSFKTRPGPDSDTRGEFSFSNFMSGDAGYFGELRFLA